MTDEQKALVERLRSVDISWSEVGEWCAEAADLIEAQAAEIAWMREALGYAWGLVEDAIYNDSVNIIRQARFMSTYYDEDGLRAAPAQETQP